MERRERLRRRSHRHVERDVRVLWLETHRLVAGLPAQRPRHRVGSGRDGIADVDEGADTKFFLKDRQRVAGHIEQDRFRERHALHRESVRWVQRQDGRNQALVERRVGLKVKAGVEGHFEGHIGACARVRDVGLRDGVELQLGHA